MKQVEQKKRPGIVERIGQVIYWCCCGLAALASVYLLIQILAAPFAPPQSLPLNWKTFALMVASIVLLWLVGRAARNILKGD